MLTPKDELEFLLELQELCEKHNVKNIAANYDLEVFAEVEGGGLIQIHDNTLSSNEYISKQIEGLENEIHCN